MKPAKLEKLRRMRPFAFRIADALALVGLLIIGNLFPMFAQVSGSGTNSVSTNRPAAQNLSEIFAEIRTQDDQIYRSVRVLKTEPDGILVNHTPDGGGIGVAKLKFRNLPESVQLKFGYDAEKAAAYETGQARAQAQLRHQILAEEQAARARHRSNELMEAKAELVLAKTKLEALRSAASASAPSLSLGSGHWVKKKIDGGKIIQLENGSLWQVSPWDVFDTVLWLPLDNITVIEGKDPGYPYQLINTDDKNSASAKPISD